MRFGDWNVANFPVQHMGPGEGQPSTIEDWSRMITAWARATQRVVNGAFGGPEYLESNIACIATNDSTPWLQRTKGMGSAYGGDAVAGVTGSGWLGGGVPAAGSVLGTRNRPAVGEMIVSQEPSVRIERILDAEAEASRVIQEAGAILEIARIQRGSTQDSASCLHIDSQVCGLGNEPEGDLISTNRDFRVDKDGTVVSPKAVIDCVHVDCIRIGQDPTGDEGDNTACTTALEATSGGLSITGYDGDTGDATFNMSLSKSTGALILESGTDFVMQSDDGSGSFTMTVTDEGVVGFLGAEKINFSGVFDPSAVGFTAQAAKPTLLTVPGIWVDTSNDLYYFDGTSNYLVMSSGGGSGSSHIVADSGTTNTPSVVQWDHQTSGTPASGFGMLLEYIADNSVNAATYLGYQVLHWTDATNGSEDGDWEFYGKSNGSNVIWMQFDGSLGEIKTHKYHTNGATTDYVMHFIAQTDDGLTPPSGFGGRHSYAAQHTTNNQRVCADLRWYWDGTVGDDSTLEWLVLDGAAGLSLLKLRGATGVAQLPNGILEFADQGTLGTPATGFARLGYDKTADSLRPRFVDDAGTETSLALLSDASGGGDHDVSDAATNSVSTAVDISHDTSGTAAAGFGVRTTYSLEHNGGSNVVAAQADVLWDDPSSVAYDGQYRIQLARGGSLQDRLKIEGDGPTTWEKTGQQTSAADEICKLVAKSTGTTAAGFGGVLVVWLEDADGNAEEAATTSWVYTDNTADTEDVDLIWKINVAGNLTEILRLDADGDGAGGTASAVRLTQGRQDFAQQTSPGTPATGFVRLSSYDGQRRSLDVMDEDGNDGSLTALVRAEATAVETSAGSETDLVTETVIFNRTNDLAVVYFSGRGTGTSSGGTFKLYVNGTAVVTQTLSTTGSQIEYVHGTIFVQRTGTNSKVWGTWITDKSTTSAVDAHYHYSHNSFGDISASGGIIIKTTGQSTSGTLTVRTDNFNVEFKGGNG